VLVNVSFEGGVA